MTPTRRPPRDRRRYVWKVYDRAETKYMIPHGPPPEAPPTRMCLTRHRPGCDQVPMDDDVLCRACSAWFRHGRHTQDRCRTCGEKLASMYAIERGECLDCDERKDDKRLKEAMRKEKAREKVRKGNVVP